METRIKPELARSMSLPARPKPATASGNDQADAVAPKQSKRSLSVTFAPAPLDEAIEAPTTPGVGVIALETPSISAVARNFGVLAKRYQDAKPEERREAFQRLSASGSRMLADFLSRDAERDVDSAWKMKSFRAGDKRNQREEPSHTCMLGELSQLSKGLGADGRKVYHTAERRRALLYAEMQQLLEMVAEQHDLNHTPELQGILVGCVLDGATHALLDSASTVHGNQYVLIKGCVLALCNALEDVMSVRSPTLLRVKRQSATERTMAWKSVLVYQPEQIIERCARSVSATPKYYLASAEQASDFRRALKRTRNVGYGEHAEPLI